MIVVCSSFEASLGEARSDKIMRKQNIWRRVMIKFKRIEL